MPQVMIHFLHLLLSKLDKLIYNKTMFREELVQKIVDEGTGTDAILIGAEIEPVAETTFALLIIMQHIKF